MINITTMRTTRHEILRSQWIEIIKKHSNSGQSIRQWCEENDVSKEKFYYWQRVIREESLIKAGVLAITGQAQFVEVKPSIAKIRSQSKSQGICAILRSNGNEIEILNGADPNTLEVALNLIYRL